MKESSIEATLRIGQRGATDTVVAEVREQIRRKKIIKVKRLKTTAIEGSEKEFWQDLAKRAGVRLLEVRGHTAVLADPRYRTEKEERRGPAPRKGRDEEE